MKRSIFEVVSNNNEVPNGRSVSLFLLSYRFPITSLSSFLYTDGISGILMSWYCHVLNLLEHQSEFGYGPMRVSDTLGR